VLLLTMHHIVSDGWSMGILFRELSALYEAYAAGGESPLPELVVQYADFAAWQRRQLDEGDGMERQLAWWKGRLSGAPALLELPADRPRPAAQRYRGAYERMEIPEALLDRLQALGRGEGATLFMVLLGAFQLLLARYTGGDDVVVGTPVAGRSRREVEGMIGFFVNMLVLRTGLSGDPTFREVLRRVREAALGAYEHQELPFERLVAELQPERSLGRSPLFQVVFTLEADGGGADGWGRSVAVDTGTAQFDLTFTAVEAGGALTAVLDYSADLYERATVARMLGHLVRVLEQVTSDPDIRISRIPLAGAEERRMLVEEWNQTDRPFPCGACIHELFDAHVRERPDAPALAWGDARWTYAELDARANRLAHHLAALSVGPESRVGVMLERGPDLIVSILAVLKAGGCYVPLDPAYPAERLRLMRVDAGIHVLITRAGLSGDGSQGASGDGSVDGLANVSIDEAEAGLRVVSLEAEAGGIATRPSDAPISNASPDNLAYIVYTSGSTGRPKGVMVAHRHVVQLVRETDYVRLAPGDRVAQASNASFDALAFETWGALLNGATLVGIPKDILLSPTALRDALRDWGITTLYQTTALLNQLSREQADVFSTLREVLFGGQAADAESVRRILRGGKPRRLLHMYGPTETTAWCSWEDVEALADDAATVSVGRPTGNARIYLLDAALQSVPVGLPGEAYVGGAGVV
ncbi:MAG TPA: AMP-binding protein, partial [Longimicrobium sp.]|nr:AMP-binding protein [Longimicrobium sp.]